MIPEGGAEGACYFEFPLRFREVTGFRNLTGPR